jgi:hypothetical protein
MKKLKNTVAKCQNENRFEKCHFIKGTMHTLIKKDFRKKLIPINNLLDKVDNLWHVFADTREAVRRKHVQGFHILIIIHIEAVLRIRDVHPGSGSRIRILILHPSRIPDPGGQKGTGSRIRNNA